jgi:hypothetical protein
METDKKIEVDGRTLHLWVVMTRPEEFGDLAP